MRVGNNPLRGQRVTGYAPVILSAITHLPNQEGYHERRLEVVKRSLTTMRKHASGDFEVLIWDNGSCSALLSWLRRYYKPDYLVESKNIGKTSARASIARMLPENTLIALGDDDIYYYPGWLEAHLEIIDTYPNVGTVSGWPVRTQFRFHNHSTIDFALRLNILEKGRFISD